MARHTRTPSPRFRKAFVGFMILVAVPSLAISGFGIMAIVDARTVAQSRLESSYTQRLQKVAAALAQELARLEQLTPVPEGADPADLTRQQASRARSVLPAVSSRFFPAEGVAVELTRDGEDVQEAAPTSATVRRRLQDWMDGRSESPDLFRRDVAAELRLPPPLAEYRLRARLVGDDLLASQVRVTAAVYTVLLLVFYVLLIVGLTLVSIAMYREVQLGRLKTDFVSHVSHELRTPLTSIRMFLETLQLGRVTSKEEEQECLRMCAQETERLSAMIERVLDWARMEAGKRTYDKQAITVRDVVEPALATFKTHALQSRYSLTMDLAAANTPILADREALSDALLNLLNNALKYTGEDKRIHLSVTSSGGHVDVAVKDNGQGVARAEQKKVFERFYRAEDVLTQRTHGSGLGLALAKRIVEAHGGKILLSSSPGRGSTFTLRLPRNGGSLMSRFLAPESA